MSVRYIPFTEEQKEQAHKTDLVSFLRSQGEKLKRSGSEYEWKDGSQKATIRGNLWFHQYDRMGGDAVGFVRRFYNKDYPEAVEYLLGGCGAALAVSHPIQKEKGEFKLPPGNANMRRVYAYLLNRRGIDKGVLDTFIYHKMIYESAKYHNAVFVGYDKDGIPRHANMRGTGQGSTFKGNAPNAKPEYSFHWMGKSGKIYLFEAPIDMLSFLSMHRSGWREHSYAAACCVSDRVLFQCMKDQPVIRKVYLCLDNDAPGQEASSRIREKLLEQGIQPEILVPDHKDWNEDLLCSFRQKEIDQNQEGEVEGPCQALQL